MRWGKLVFVVLFILVIPVFLVASNVRWVISTPLLYNYGFDRYDIPDRTGIERSELRRVGSEIREYFDNSEEFLNVRVSQHGIIRNLYNEREVLHMRDVKSLVRGVFILHTSSAAFIISFILVGFWLQRTQFIPYLSRYVSLGGILCVLLVVCVGLASLVGFERLFWMFHIVSFSNDLWQLDPNSDYLLMMFPESFFFDATMWIAGSTVLEGVILGLFALRSGWSPFGRQPDRPTG